MLSLSPQQVRIGLIIFKPAEKYFNLGLRVEVKHLCKDRDICNYLLTWVLYVFWQFYVESNVKICPEEKSDLKTKGMSVFNCFYLFISLFIYLLIDWFQKELIHSGGLCFSLSLLEHSVMEHLGFASSWYTTRQISGKVWPKLRLKAQ